MYHPIGRLGSSAIPSGLIPIVGLYYLYENHKEWFLSGVAVLSGMLFGLGFLWSWGLIP